MTKSRRFIHLCDILLVVRRFDSDLIRQSASAAMRTESSDQEWVFARTDDGWQAVKINYHSDNRVSMMISLPRLGGASEPDIQLNWPTSIGGIVPRQLSSLIQKVL